MSSLVMVAERADKFAVRYDEERGYIFFSLMGFVSEEESFTCYTTLSRLWEDARLRHGRVLFLVDASKAQVQAPALIKQMTGSNPMTVSREDRIAFVVASSLLKMQFKREVDATMAAVEFFMSLNAAETWVLAFEPK